MKIRILAIGPKMPAWVEIAVAEYVKRMPPELPVEFVSLPLGQRGRNASLDKAIAREGDAMLAALGPDDQVVALDLSGQAWSTVQLADQLSGWRLAARDLVLLIGGPDGLDPRLRAKAGQRWCLSNLTLPHALVRVLVAEQLYRAWTVTQNHPYHK